MTPVTPPYRYGDLLPGSNSIRLLRLLPSKDGNAVVQCQLFDCSLRESQAHPYDALSYVWGELDETRFIRVDKHDLPVTPNLHKALTRLRHPYIERIIWVDAICINQKNDDEKEKQIKFMAKIYGQAGRVLVWLGAAADNSDYALEELRDAGGKMSSKNLHNEAIKNAVLALLERRWFQRIWVLQEMAAARHVLIMCGPAEIDGHAFCLGFELLATTLEDSMCQITYLIRGAIFRPRQISEKQERSTYSLGELVDMYHAHEATILHDKVYALLGMSSDDLNGAGLNPDYKVRWETLMQSLVKFLLGKQLTVYASHDREMAVIKSKGYAIGQVSSVTTKQDNRRDIYITLNDVLGNLKETESRTVCWNLPSSAKPIKEGDVICLLQGAQKPTIVRACQEYFAIIMITAIPPEKIQPALLGIAESAKSFTRDFLLVWDWERSSENLQDSGKYDSLIRELSKIEFEGQLAKATRTWNLAEILGDVGQKGEAEEKEQEAGLVYERTLGGENLHTLESQYDLIPLSWAARNGYEAVVKLLLATDKVDVESKDGPYGRTPLSWAAGNGYEAVVKLLLATDKVDVEFKVGPYGRTPLSLAAGNGYEAVVKLLLATGKVDVKSKDGDGQTPLSLAAGKGHEAVVKLLLATDKVDVKSKDGDGQTPLSLAAGRGHEAVVKLLLATDNVDVESKDRNGRTPLSWAAGNRHEAVVKLLLATDKVDVESKDGDGRTPLLLAAGNGHEAVVKLLLATDKVHVESKDGPYGRTPLLLAARNGHEAVVKLLLATDKVDIESKDGPYGRTPLLLAARNGHEAVVKLLLATDKVDVESKDAYGRTPLSLAAGNGHEAVVKLLQLST